MAANIRNYLRQCPHYQYSCQPAHVSWQCCVTAMYGLSVVRSTVSRTLLQHLSTFERLWIRVCSESIHSPQTSSWVLHTSCRSCWSVWISECIWRRLSVSDEIGFPLLNTGRTRPVQDMSLSWISWTTATHSSYSSSTCSPLSARPPRSLHNDRSNFMNLKTIITIGTICLRILKRLRARQKGLRCRRETARRSRSVETLLTLAQLLYEKSYLKKLAIGEWPWMSFKVI